MAKITPAQLAKLANENVIQDKPRKPLGKKLGVYVNGKLKFQSREAEAIYAYKDKMIADFRNNVWLCHVGSFVDA